MSEEVLVIDVEKGVSDASPGIPLAKGTVLDDNFLMSFGHGAGELDDENGPLNPDQVKMKREHYGMNCLAQEKKNAWYTVLLQSFLHPFNILLCIIAILSTLEDYTTPVIISIMIIISTALRFYQEWKSEGAVHGLLKLITKSVSVIRFDPNGRTAREMSIPSEELVPGDHVVLRPGEIVPADAVILSSKVFFVSQAPFTGEALPVEKYELNEDLTPAEMQERRRMTDEKIRRVSSHKQMSKCKRFFRTIFGLKINTESQLDHSGFELKEDLTLRDHVFMGTQVITGMAVVVVSRTGHRTLFGKMADALTKTSQMNPFQLGVRRISWIFFFTMLLMIPPVFIARWYWQKDWKPAFLFSLSVAVGLTPEMLPMIVNANLAKGSLEMSRKSTIIKKLDAIINLGAVDVLCTDKTGTLTKSVVQLDMHINPYGSSCNIPLKIGYLNSYFQSVLQNPLDTAITSYYDKIAQPSNENDEEGDPSSRENMVKKNSAFLEPDIFVHLFSRVDEIPFDFVRRRLSVILKENGKENIYLICKGAVEEILSVCTKVAVDCSNKKVDIFPTSSDIVPLKPEMITNFKAESEQHTEKGQRVLGVAFKTLPSTTASATVEDECDLVFVGFLAFTDPPKESARPAIQELIRHNIEIKVLTGDSPNICAAVCQELHLPVKSIVSGEEIIQAQEIGPVRVEELIRHGTIFAKLTPLQKLFVVKMIKEQNHTVGFMGDGINDAPALKEADVGISVENGLDICRESADVILLDKDLSIVVTGIRTGRKTYGNTIKYIVMAVSSNFGNVFSVLVASFWLPYEPMSNLHLLTQNLLYDFSQIGIPWDSVDDDFLTVPHKWRIRSILRFMVWMGPWSSVFDITTFAYMKYHYNIHKDEDAEKEKVQLFQTAWFTVGLLTQTLIVHMIRTPKIPIIQSRASIIMTLTTLSVMAIGGGLPYIPELNKKLGFHELDAEFYCFLAAVLVGYCLVANLAKCIYIKIFKEWF